VDKTIVAASKQVAWDTRGTWMSTTASSATSSGVNPYDAVPYQSDPFAQTHPRLLATIAALFNLPAAPVESCRVLELGCAGGGNIIPVAQDLPQSRFIGVDYSAIQIEQGLKDVAALKLPNIELRHASILDIDSSWGTFDYIICHGVYSWVPPAVQEKILDIAATLLSPDGIAYISYNTYPGWHMRGIVRDMMRYHALRFADPVRRVKQARLILDFVMKHSSGGQNTAYNRLLKQETEMLAKAPDHYILHEHLEEHCEAIYFHEFITAVRAKGLDYLGEARMGVMGPASFGPEAHKTLREIANDLVEVEQFMDFLRSRSFRETLVHRAGPNRSPKYQIHPERAWPLHVASSAKPVEGEPKDVKDAKPLAPEQVDLRPGQPVTFRSRTGVPVGTPTPLLKAALLCLGRLWPSSISFDELAKLARERLAGVEGIAPSDPQKDRMSLGEALLKVYTRSDTVEFYVSPPRFATEPGPRPLASAVARHLSTHSRIVTNHRHERALLRPAEVQVLQLLDGTNDASAIAAKLNLERQQVESAIKRIAGVALLTS
jgi:SAM-dependent methyltransferase